MEPSVTDNDTNDKITISDAKQANAMHEHILGSLKKTTREMIAVGEYLCAVRTSKKRGEWGPWVENNLTFSEHTAREYIALYKRSQRNNGFELIEVCRLVSPVPVKKVSNAGAKATAAAPPIPIPGGVNEAVVNDLLSTGQFTREQAITVARRAEPAAEPGKTIPQPAEQPREEPARTVRIDDLEPVRPGKLDNLADMVGLCANLEEIEEDDYEAVEEFAQQFAQTAFELFDVMVDNCDPEEMLDRFKEAVANLKM